MNDEALHFMEQRAKLIHQRRELASQIKHINAALINRGVTTTLGMEHDDYVELVEASDYSGLMPDTLDDRS